MKKNKNRKINSELPEDAERFIREKKLPRVFRYGYEYVIKWGIGRKIFSHLTDFKRITDIQKEFKSSTAVNATMLLDKLGYLESKDRKIKSDMRKRARYRIRFKPLLEYWEKESGLNLSDDEEDKLENFLNFWILDDMTLLKEIGIDRIEPLLRKTNFTLVLSEKVRKQMGVEWDKIENLRFSFSSGEMMRDLKRGVSDFKRFGLYKKEKPFPIEDDIIWRCENCIGAFLGDLLLDTMLDKNIFEKETGIADFYVNDFYALYDRIMKTKKVEKAIEKTDFRKILEEIKKDFKELQELPEPPPMKNEEILNQMIMDYFGIEMMIKLFKSFKTYREVDVFIKIIQLENLIKKINMIRKNMPIRTVPIKKVKFSKRK